MMRYVTQQRQRPEKPFYHASVYNTDVVIKQLPPGREPTFVDAQWPAIKRRACQLIDESAGLSYAGRKARVEAKALVRGLTLADFKPDPVDGLPRVRVGVG